MKKVLIVYAMAGEGHKIAASALKEAMDILNPPDTQVQIIDSLEYTNAFFKWSYSKFYIFMVKYIPTIWGFFYFMLDLRWFYAFAQFIRRMINKCNTDRLERFILDFKPDIILSTHFLASEVISSLKRRSALKTCLITCVTDFRMHSFWYSRQTDLFCVGFAETKGDLVRKWKIPPERVLVSGIPVQVKFYTLKNRYEIYGRRALTKDLFTVLISGGGFGVGPIMAMVKKIIELRLCMQVLVVCGHNKRLLDQISKLATSDQRLTTILKPFGFIDYVDELMEVADLGVTKAGGLICSESIAKGLPLIIIAPIPGQESRNCRLLLKNRAAFRIQRPSALKKVIATMYRNTDILKEMRSNIRSIKRENPSMHIAKLTLRTIK